ncbi:neural cell adhesion molecule 1-like [Ostrea edulis]|uniref:neural cell adhesion molecule 1-like n=1 Tax=Ostrea edulis TaxID=37623 RepID=UPI0020961300|nr:neural cell adhesion molecule 1-like [Ostrea edulis]
MMIISGIFLLLFIPGDTECTVLVQPSPIANVTYGKPLYFSCTFPPSWESATLNIPGETGFKFAIFNGGPCYIPNDKRADYSIACHGNTLTYGIMKPRDNTIWRCTFSSSSVTEHGNTTVSLQADKPVILTQRNTYTIIEGSNISIPCTFTGAPIYNTTWEHDNIVLQWSAQTQPMVLSLQNVSRSAAGNYTCNVYVTFKGTYTASNTVYLIVDYPPTLEASNVTTVNEGTRAVSLGCEILVDGYPRNYSDLYWQHWIGNQLIRELASNTPLTIPTVKKYTLTLKSVSYNDAGRYVCLMGNGISNLYGNVKQTAEVELVVQAIPRILRSKNEYHGQVGQTLKIQFKSMGHPEVHCFINSSLGEITTQFKTTETLGPVVVDIHDEVIKMNGTILEMDFGKIEHRFSTRYQLIAENSMGRVTHSFLVQGHDFPSKPFHIHFKEYEASAFLEWEAVSPDLDMTYEVILKNYTGDDILNIIPGSNAKIYEYWLTNLTLNTDNILLLCTTNALGRNCSSTFKIKMDKPISITLQAHQMPISKTTLIAIVVGCVGLLSILVFILIAWNRRKHRKSKNLFFLERQNVPLGRNSYSMERLTNDLESSENNCERTMHLSTDTYLTPQCLTSPQSQSPSCQSNMDGNEYASVDDPTVRKLAAQRNQNVGKFLFNSGKSMNTGNVPNLPSRVTHNASNTMVTPEATPRNEYMEMGKTTDIPKSNMSPSLLLKLPNQTFSEDCEFTHYVSMDDEDDKKSPEVQNGGHGEDKHPKKYVRK